MVAAISAGLLIYSVSEGKLKVFLVHPGEPFFNYTALFNASGMLRGVSTSSGNFEINIWK
jgi:predicted NUDIX family NTP pyrophosphohydrolase